MNADWVLEQIDTKIDRLATVFIDTGENVKIKHFGEKRKITTVNIIKCYETIYLLIGIINCFFKKLLNKS